MPDDIKCDKCGYEQPCKFLKFSIGFLALLITVSVYSVGSLNAQAKELTDKYNAQAVEYSSFKSQTQTYLQEQRIIFAEIKSDVREIKTELNRMKTERAK